MQAGCRCRVQAEWGVGGDVAGGRLFLLNFSLGLAQTDCSSSV